MRGPHAATWTYRPAGPSAVPLPGSQSETEDVGHAAGRSAVPPPGSQSET